MGTKWRPHERLSERLRERWKRLWPASSTEAFDRLGRDYAGEQIPVIALNEVLLRREVGSLKGTAIDVGSGPGNSTAILLEAGAPLVHCVDTSAVMLALNTERNGSDRVRTHWVSPRNETPTLEASVDLVLFSQCLGFMRDPEGQIAFYAQRVAHGGAALVLRINEKLEDMGPKPLDAQSGRVWAWHKNRPSSSYVQHFKSSGLTLAKRATLTVTHEERALIPVDDATFRSRFFGREILESLRFER